MRFEGKAVLITGAQGIGRACAARFVDEGAQVAIVDRNRRVGEAAATAIGATFIEADVATKADVDGTALAVFGSGPTDGVQPPIVLLHAAVADSRSRAAQFERFGDARRVVAYDRRGFGETAASDAALADFLDELASR